MKKMKKRVKYANTLHRKLVRQSQRSHPHTGSVSSLTVLLYFGVCLFLPYQSQSPYDLFLMTVEFPQINIKLNTTFGIHLNRDGGRTAAN